MNNIPDTFGNYFNIVYRKNGYLDKYGGSLVATAITLIIFFIIISYFYIQNKLEPIKQDWANQRCRPEVMPFAGMINAPKGTSKVEYTSENFVQCTTTILKKIVDHAMTPINYITNLMTNLYDSILNSVNMIRTFINFLRIKLRKIFEYLIARLYNVLVPLQNILIKVRDTLGKTAGIATASLFTVYAGYLALKAFIGAMIEMIIIALLIAFGVLVALWVLIFTWPAAAVGTAFFILISIPLAVIAAWMAHILRISSRKVPPKPGCFDKNTVIETQNGNIPIKKLKSGTILKNGDKVSAVFKLALNNRDMYQLDKIRVSGSHKVFYNNLGWIKVEEHPDSIKINNYREPFIYCFSTETKRLNIQNHKFLDWDDLEPIDIIKLKNLEYLQNDSSLSEIHQYLESGIDGSTMIELDNGQSIKLKNIQINDQLYFGERVIGLVEIDTKNICSIKKYLFKNFSIIGAPNLHFNDSDLGNFNTLNIQGEEVYKPKKLYHLLTDTGYFTIDGHKLRDYNAGIENILDIRDKLFALF